MQYGNTVPNAAKWTEKVVQELLEEIHWDSRQADVLYLGSSLIKHDLYKDVWRYWKKIFARNDDIIEKMLKIETVFEVRLYEAAMNKEISPAVAMMGLKRHHGWGNKEEDARQEPEPEQLSVRLDKDTILILDGPGELNKYKRLYNPPPYKPADDTIHDMPARPFVDEARRFSPP